MKSKDSVKLSWETLDKLGKMCRRWLKKMGDASYEDFLNDCVVELLETGVTLNTKNLRAAVNRVHVRTIRSRSNDVSFDQIVEEVDDGRKVHRGVEIRPLGNMGIVYRIIR